MILEDALARPLCEVEVRGFVTVYTTIIMVLTDFQGVGIDIVRICCASTCRRGPWG